MADRFGQTLSERKGGAKRDVVFGRRTQVRSGATRYSTRQERWYNRNASPVAFLKTDKFGMFVPTGKGGSSFKFNTRLEGKPKAFLNAFQKGKLSKFFAGRYAGKLNRKAALNNVLKKLGVTNKPKSLQQRFDELLSYKDPRNKFKIFGFVAKKAKGKESEKLRHDRSRNKLIENILAEQEKLKTKKDKKRDDDPDDNGGPNGPRKGATGGDRKRSGATGEGRKEKKREGKAGKGKSGKTDRGGAAGKGRKKSGAAGKGKKKTDEKKKTGGGKAGNGRTNRGGKAGGGKDKTKTKKDSNKSSLSKSLDKYQKAYNKYKKGVVGGGTSSGKRGRPSEGKARKKSEYTPEERSRAAFKSAETKRRKGIWSRTPKNKSRSKRGIGSSRIGKGSMF